MESWLGFAKVICDSIVFLKAVGDFHVKVHLL